MMKSYPFSSFDRCGPGLWLVKRGPRSPHHRAPFHPVIVCSRKHTAKWEAGWTGDRAWVWSHDSGSEAAGWLLERWEGLDLDYGGLVKGGNLPDGTPMGFAHKHRSLGYDMPGEAGARFLGYSDELQEPWSLLPGAVWWSDHPMPTWLEDLGVVLAEDDFTVQRIEEDAGSFALGYAGEQKLRHRRWNGPGRRCSG